MELNVAEIKPSVLSWTVIGLSATTFIVFFRWLFSRVKIPGVSDFFLSL